MSFEQVEQSEALGTPVELYEFSYTGEQFCYTSAAKDEVKEHTIFRAIPIQRSDLKVTDDLGKQDLTITLALDSEVAEVFRVAPPSEVVSLKIFRKHRLDNQEEFSILWVGRVLGASWGKFEVELQAESALTSLNRKISRRRYSPTCSHMLYSRACGVRQETVETQTVVVEVTGNIIQTNLTYADDWFAGGVMTWQIPNSGRIETRSIMRSPSTGEMELNSSPLGLRAGMSIKVYPGCGHTLQVCHSKFNNAENYGGFPFFPEKNPFGDAPIY